MNDISKIKSNRIDDGIKPGDLCYSLRTEKEGWLLCDGTSYSTTDYPDLFTVIGYTFGGSNSQFNVPNCSGKFLQMDTSKTIGQNIEAGLPNITGQFPTVRKGKNSAIIEWPNGAFYNIGTASGNFYSQGGADDWVMAVDFQASRSSSIYGKSNTVQPSAIIVNYFIKY